MILSTKHLQVGYNEQTIVRDVNLSFQPGKFYALLGPNGCGKSTLLNTLAQTLPARSGEVFWQQQPLAQYSAKQRAAMIAMLAQQQPTPEGVTVAQLIGFGRTPYSNFWGQLNDEDKQVIEQMLSACELQPLRNKPLSALSGGQRQRAWLAMALAQQGQVLLLDEPTTYLDLNHQVALMQLLVRLRTQGKTIIAVLHDLNQACRYCDELIVIGHGEVIASGLPESVITPELLRHAFSIEASIHHDPVNQTPMIIAHESIT